MEVSTEVRQAAKEYANAISEQKGFILGGINWANFVDAFIAGASYREKEVKNNNDGRNTDTDITSSNNA